MDILVSPAVYIASITHVLMFVNINLTIFVIFLIFIIDIHTIC